MNKDSKINVLNFNSIEKAIHQTNEGYTTGMLLYEKSENDIRWYMSEKGINDLHLEPIPSNEFKPEIKAILLILPYSEIKKLNNLKKE